MDKLVELILSLRNDIAALRSDVHTLSDKVDQLNTGAVQSGTVAQSVQRQASQTQIHQASYGRQLSPSEQTYLDRLHGSRTSTNSQESNMTGVINKTEQNGEYIQMLEENVPQAPQPVYQRVASEPGMIERFFKWFSKDWPMKIGGFFVIAAIGWFVTFASQQGWLSETARVVLGYIFAATCIAFGALRAETERVQGNLFLIIGSASLLIATIGGIEYSVSGITPVTGLFIMLLSVGFVTLVSLRQKSYALTSSLIIFGAMIPIFFFSGVDATILYLYLFVLTIGTLWIVLYTQWRSLTFMMVSVVGFYSLAFIATESRSEIESVLNIIIAFIFIGALYFSNVAAIIKSQKIYLIDMCTAIGTGILFLMWMLSFAFAEAEVFLLLVGVLMFAIASYVIFRLSGHRSPTILYGGVSGFLFVIATALQFNGASLVIAYVMEAAVFNFALIYFARTQMTTGLRFGVLAIYAVPLLMSIGSVFDIFTALSYGHDFSLGVLPHLFVVFVTCITSFGLAIVVIRLLDCAHKENMTLFRIFAYVGGAYALLLIWFVTHLLMFDYDVATFVSLVIYTIVGVVFYVMGARDGYRPYMLVGSILFGIVVVRVIFVEFWEMDVLMRIITFAVLGALLISTAFIRSSHKR